MKKIKQFIPKLRLLLFLLLFNSSPIIAQIKSEIIIEKENSYHSLSNLISDIVKNNNIDTKETSWFWYDTSKVDSLIN